jgi:hypothetical protein
MRNFHPSWTAFFRLSNAVANQRTRLTKSARKTSLYLKVKAIIIQKRDLPTNVGKLNC